MRGIYKQKTFWIGFVWNFVLQIIITIIFCGLFGEKLLDFLNIRSKYEYINYFINLFASLILNAILFSTLSLFVKEKVQWILGSIIGSIVSAVLFTILVYLFVVPTVRRILPSGPLLIY